MSHAVNCPYVYINTHTHHWCIYIFHFGLDDLSLTSAALKEHIVQMFLNGGQFKGFIITKGHGRATVVPCSLTECGIRLFFASQRTALVASDNSAHGFTHLRAFV